MATPRTTIFFWVPAVLGALALFACQGGARSEPPRVAAAVKPVESAKLPRRDFEDLFRIAGVRKISGVLQDYSGVNAGAENYYQAAPTTPAAVAEIVGIAAEHHVALRVRGRGNSLNGSSLPRAGELLISTEGLRTFRFVRPGVVEMGGGISMFGVRKWLQHYGYDLPVAFDGPGPSLAGFLAGGGVSRTSKEFGGFWDNVERIGLVDGRGAVREVARGDALFPWLFGSMGQLGVVTTVQLRVIPYGETRRPIPAEGRVDEQWERNDHAVMCSLEATRGKPRWLVVFVPQGESAKAEAKMKELAARYAKTLVKPFTFVFPVADSGLVAPLVYSHAAGFSAVGLWTFVDAAASAGELAAFDQDYDRFVAANARFRRYIQGEAATSPDTIRASFAPEIYQRFLEWKLELDPYDILNPGILEAVSTAP